MVKKIDGDSSRQLRVSLARSYQPPTTDQLTLRPQINPFAPCAGNTLCVANTIDTADSSGNPHLQPERSHGLNISYEHGIGTDSQFTLELYARQIDRKIGTDITLENVPWASAPRYVSRPTNLGNATVQGIDMEMLLASRDIWPNAPKLDVRGSVGLARSQISSILGPDNRLDKQTPWRAKLGVSYAVKGLPLKFDMDANWAPGGWVRTNATQRIFQDRAFNLGASASWTINPDTRLFINLDNLVAHKSQRVDEYINPEELVRQQTTSTTDTRLSVRLQIKL
ncbi:MAG: TonB-dependent receptor [Pseudomonadota bacterium]